MCLFTTGAYLVVTLKPPINIDSQIEVSFMNKHRSAYAYLFTLSILTSLLSGCAALAPQESYTASNSAKSSDFYPTLNDHYNYLKQGPNQIKYNIAQQENYRQRNTTQSKKLYSNYNPQPAQQVQAEEKHIERERKIASEHAAQKARATKKYTEHERNTAADQAMASRLQEAKRIERERKITDDLATQKAQAAEEQESEQEIASGYETSTQFMNNSL